MNQRRLTSTVLCVLAAALPSAAQVGNYNGPGILSRGGGEVGNRSGQQVNLRFWAGVNGIYDNGLLPFGVDSNGQVLRVGALMGVEGQLGAYGTHNWRRALLGLDYAGNYRKYTQNTYFSGSNQVLSLGYTFQPTRRFAMESRVAGGSLQQGISGIGGGIVATDAFDPNTSLLFDNRVHYLQGGMRFNFIKSARTIFTAGGDTFTARRQNRNLVGVNGYTISGGIQRRVSRDLSIGADYSRIHFDYPRAFGESDIDAIQGLVSKGLGRFWTLYVAAGIFRTEVQGLQRINLDPAIAAILGTFTGVQTFYRRNTIPAGTVRLTRTWRTANLNVEYSRGLNPGNGVFLTSRQETANAGMSYTGIRKWTLSINGGRNVMSALGQDLQSYQAVQANVGATYNLGKDLYLVTQAGIRHQDFGDNQTAGFRRTATRFSVGFTYSPGDIPFSLW